MLSNAACSGVALEEQAQLAAGRPVGLLCVEHLDAAEAAAVRAGLGARCRCRRSR